MTRYTLALLSALAAQPALALSCLPPDPVALYERARDADERYMIVRGRILPSGTVNLPVEGKEAETQARVEGMALSEDGFVRPFDRPATLRLLCFGPWCANAPDPEAETFMAVQLDGPDLVVEIGPCLDNHIGVEEGDEDRVLACHRDGTCVGRAQ